MKALMFLMIILSFTSFAAETWTASGVNVDTLLFNNDDTVGKYTLYAFLQEDTSVSELTQRFAQGGFDDFKASAIANEITSSGLSETKIWMEGLFLDKDSRDVLFEDGISLNLYAVAVYDETHFNVMNECFRIVHSNPNYSGGTWNAFATPEPTSGVLLLLGLSALALKRKIRECPRVLPQDDRGRKADRTERSVDCG